MQMTQHTELIPAEARNEIDLDTAVQRIEENLGLYFSEQQ